MLISGPVIRDVGKRPLKSVDGGPHLFYDGHMKKLRTLVLVGIACIVTACSSVPNAKTNYVAPSTGQVRTHVTSAQGSVASASTKATNVTNAISSATTRAQAASEKLVKLAEMTAEQPTLNSLAVSIKGDVDALTQILMNANAENESLKADLGQTAESLRQAQIQSLDLQTQINTQTNQLNEANKNLNSALAQSAVDRHNAHVFKGIIIGTSVFAVAAILFGIFGYAAFAPPLLYAMLGAPTIVGIALFFWLG